MRRVKPVDQGKAFELRIAKRTGAMRIPGSGSGPEKEDLVDDFWLIQAKSTRNRSRQVSLGEWDELKFHALQVGKKPRMEFEIAGEVFVILGVKDFDELDKARLSSI